jgi:hypothetical protein
MSDDTYKSIPEIINQLKTLSDQLESGNMPASELETMLDNVRELYERMVVLRYKALEAEAKKEEPVVIPGPEPEPEVKEEAPVVEESTESFGEIKFSVGIPEEQEPEVEETRELEPEVEPEPEVEQVAVPEVEKTPEPEPVEVEESAPETPIEAVNSPEKQVQPDIHPNQTNLLDAIEERQKEESFNEKFASSESKSVGDKLQKSRIEDLKKAIGINMKYLFMNDLFEGENTIFNEAVDQLNEFGNWDEAKSYMNTLQEKYNWDQGHKSVVKFTELVERRYV